MTTTESGGFLDLINISSSDITYSLICGRSLTDLYSGISSKGTDITSENTSFCLSLLGDKSIASQKDKLWLMSYKEVMTFFEDTNDARAWGSKYYWLRSPGPTEGNLVYYIHTNGSVSNGFGLTEYENTPRPCFKIA